MMKIDCYECYGNGYKKDTVYAIDTSIHLSDCPTCGGTGKVRLLVYDQRKVSKHKKWKTD